MVNSKKNRRSNSGKNYNILATKATDSFNDNFDSPGSGGGGPGAAPELGGFGGTYVPPMTGGGGSTPTPEPQPETCHSDVYYGYSKAAIDQANCNDLNVIIEDMIYLAQNFYVPAACRDRMDDMKARLIYAQNVYANKCNPSYQPETPVTTPVSQVPVSDIPATNPNDDPWSPAGDPGFIPPVTDTPIAFDLPHVDPTEVEIPPTFGGYTPAGTEPTQVETGDPTIDSPEIPTATLDGEKRDSPPTISFMAPPNMPGAPGGATGQAVDPKFKSYLAIAIAASLAGGFLLFGNKNIAGGAL